MTTREQDATIELVAQVTGRVRVERLTGGNVRLTVIIDPDGNTVEELIEGSSECHSPAAFSSSHV